MCFYNQYLFACGDYRWGHFQQHCSKEYRTGETCGIKLPMNTFSKSENCRLCHKIETKDAKLRKEHERIRRWMKGGGDPQGALANQSWNEIEKLEGEISSLLQIRVSGTTVVEDTEDTEPELTAQAGISSGISFKSLSVNQSSKVGSPNLDESSTRIPSNDIELAKTHATGQEPSLRLFPIHASKDATLIASWKNRALPNIKHLTCTGDDLSISISLLRQGKTLEDSKTIVRIQTSKPRSEQQQAEIIQCIVHNLLPLSAPRVLFVAGSIKRTAKRSDLDLQPCAGRNTAFLRRPPMGASIGIEGSVKDTATLGGYIYIDQIPHILTVHHLFVDDDTAQVYEAGTAITQPSLQEVKEFGELWDHLKSTGESFHLDCVRKAFDELKACLPEFSFGNLIISSGYRNRASRDGLSNVEMDWALCRVTDRRVGFNESPCKRHLCQQTSSVTPGSAVFAIGRTSGHQNGNINGCTTSLFLQNDDGSYRESDEWAILRPNSMPEETWVTYGIGVSGDSGAWIVEHGTDNLIGQLWGRDFHEQSSGRDGEIITYFTPILDIFDDIREFTGAAKISISTNEKSDPAGEQQRSRVVSSPQTLPFQTSASIGGAVAEPQTMCSETSAGFLCMVEPDTPGCEMRNDATADSRNLKTCELNSLVESTRSANMCWICRKNMPGRDASIEASRAIVAQIEHEIFQLKIEREQSLWRL